ncbi:MAG: hypothetical protein LBK95_12455 [Bifidobacteriaceae bacterium]|jgi:hypothetical protein|nr:hypothetical protein [Bifidobacteriaceae bacterium]
MNRLAAFKGTLLVAGVCAVLVGCTSGPAIDQDEPRSSQSALSGEDAGLRAASWWTPAPDDMPFAPYFGALKAEEDVLGAAIRDERRKWWDDTHAFVSECMLERGFDYQPESSPYDQPQSSRGHPGGRDRLALALPVPLLAEQRSYVQDEGYGVMPVAVDLDEAMESDPNWQYKASLSPAAHREYEKAMTGYYPEDDHESPPDVPGCGPKAQETYPDPWVEATKTTAGGIYADLVSSMYVSIHQGLLRNPDFQALNKSWQDCMVGKGYDTGAIPGQPGPNDGPTGGMNLAIGTGADGTVADPAAHDVGSLPADQRSLTGSDPERAVALADFDCRVAADYEPRLTEIMRAVQEQFVADNDKALTEMLALARTNAG